MSIHNRRIHPCITGGGATHAQKDEQVLDKIVCKRLEVVNKEGTTVAGIVATEDGNGTIQTYNDGWRTH